MKMKILGFTYTNAVIVYLDINGNKITETLATNIPEKDFTIKDIKTVLRLQYEKDYPNETIDIEEEIEKE